MPKKQPTQQPAPETNGTPPSEEALPAIAQSQVAAAMNSVPDSAKAGVAAAVVQAVPDAAKIGFVSAAMDSVPDVAKAGIATATVQGLSDSAKADLAAAAARAVEDPHTHAALLERLAPDQVATNDIWRWIVKTFAFVLCGATAALVAAVFVSDDSAELQMLLTVFTTTAGILAGFVSGRASTSRAR